MLIFVNELYKSPLLLLLLLLIILTQNPVMKLHHVNCCLSLNCTNTHLFIHVQNYRNILPVLQEHFTGSHKTQVQFLHLTDDWCPDLDIDSAGQFIHLSEQSRQQ